MLILPIVIPLVLRACGRGKAHALIQVKRFGCIESVPRTTCRAECARGGARSSAPVRPAYVRYCLLGGFSSCTVSQLDENRARRFRVRRPAGPAQGAQFFFQALQFTDPRGHVRDVLIE
jgi:hypothetical protein